MRRRSALRRFLKWLMAGTAVVVALLIGVSAFVWIGVAGGKYKGGIISGQAWVQLLEPQYHGCAPQIVIDHHDDGLCPTIYYATWWINVQNPYGMRVVVVAMWIPAALAAGLAALLWWRDRTPPNHCRKCWYDLTGNRSGRCPECGTPAGESVPPGSAR